MMTWHDRLPPVQFHNADSVLYTWKLNLVYTFSSNIPYTITLVRN